MTILGYGAMELRGQPYGPAIDDGGAGRLLNEVLDAGISLIDTWPEYRVAEGDEMLAPGGGRQHLVISSWLADVADASLDVT